MLIVCLQLELHNLQPINNFPGLGTTLWDYQKIGITKIIKCWERPYKGCILADEMGLGKTVQSIEACLIDKDQTPSCFSLIVTTKTCVGQWADQIKTHFEEVSS